MWLVFLHEHNGVPMGVHGQPLTSDQMHLQTDASFMVGAAVMGRKWFIIQYLEAWRALNIAFLEFYPIVAVSLFAEELENTYTFQFRQHGYRPCDK